MFNNFLSRVIVLQCFTMIFEMIGSLGLYVTVNITLLFFSFITLSKAFSLGINLAFSMAATTMFLLYCLDKSMSFNSDSLVSSFVWSLTILTSLSARE